MGITYSNLGLVTNSMGGGRLINQRLRCVNTLFTERYIKKYRDKNNLNIKFVAKGANKTEIICCRDQQEVEEFLDHFNHLTRFDAHITLKEQEYKMELLKKDNIILKMEGIIWAHKSYILQLETDRQASVRDDEYPFWNKTCIKCDDYFLTDDDTEAKCDVCTASEKRI
jgi:hypothetical protein